MPEAGERDNIERAPVVEGATGALGLCVFAVFVGAGWPLVILSVLALTAVAVVIGRSLGAARSPAAVLHVSRPTRRAATVTALGCAVGFALGIGLRWAKGEGLLPGALGRFALVAAAIGAAEELAYRGYIQGRFRTLGVFPAAAFAALCHAGYKCALFLYAPASAPATDIDFTLLAAGTFLGGVAFGALRELGRSAFPAIAAHACFDVVVYGGLARAPWWVWP